MIAHDISRRMESVRFGTLLVLLAASFVLGGASRNDVASLMLLQPFAVVCGTIFLLTGPIRWSSVRIPMLLLLALAALMAIQLVPLPPELWTRLPGHGPFAASAAVVGLEQPWRGISLTPDLTLASLVGLAVPAAVLMGFASLPPERTWGLLLLLIGGVAASALVGLAQIAGGQGSPFYFYEITNRGSPVGFFSNRNHLGVLLAMAWPMLAIWADLPAEQRLYDAKRWIAMSLAILLLPLLLATGSRAGLVLGAIGLAASLLLWSRRSRSSPPRDRLSALLMGTGLAAALCVIGATIVLSRDEALQRATGVSFDQDVRFEYLPRLIEISRDFFPVGAGFGGFDPIFRYYEPTELLQPTYLNHAHNDLVELTISGGLPGLVILAIFLAWLGVRATKVLTSSQRSRSVAFAWLGLIMIVIMLLSSLVDYPLRTPLMAALFAVACGWLSDYAAPERRGSGQR